MILVESFILIIVFYIINLVFLKIKVLFFGLGFLVIN